MWGCTGAVRSETTTKTTGRHPSTRAYPRPASQAAGLKQLVDGIALGKDHVRPALVVERLLRQVHVEVAVDGRQHVVRELGQILGSSALRVGGADGPTALHAAARERAAHEVGPVVAAGFLVDHR